MKDSCVNCMEKMQEVNLLRYQLHCAKAGKVNQKDYRHANHLCSCISQANYQAGVWRRAIYPFPEVPLPGGHGWEIAEGEITVKWLHSKPAPKQILEFLSCSCKKSCLNEDCCCFKSGLKCTDICSVNRITLQVMKMRMSLILSLILMKTIKKTKG